MASPHAAEKAEVLFQVKHCQTTSADTPLAPALGVAIVNSLIKTKDLLLLSNAN